MEAEPRTSGGPRFEQLTEFCYWWDSPERKGCCQFQDEATIEGDPDQFDCENCPVAERVAELDSENREAWGCFQSVTCRLTMECPGLVVPVFSKLVEDKSPVDAADLLERMGKIYDTVCPPPAQDD